MIDNDPFETRAAITKFVLKGGEDYRDNRLLDYINDINPRIGEHKYASRELFDYFYSLYEKYPDLFTHKEPNEEMHYLYFSDMVVTRFYVPSHNINRPYDTKTFFKRWNELVIDDETRRNRVNRFIHEI